MESQSQNNMAPFVAALAGIIATVYMATGPWDIFDISVSLVLLALGIYWLVYVRQRIDSKAEVALFTLVFATFSTALVIGVSVIVALATKTSAIALFDYSTSAVLSAYDNDKLELLSKQARGQICVFLAGCLVWALILSVKYKRDQRASNKTS